MVMSDEPDKTANQISIYGARGMLIESQGPSWFYGTGSEHAVLYNYQLSNATNVREESCLISTDPAFPHLLPVSLSQKFLRI